MSNTVKKWAAWVDYKGHVQTIQLDMIETANTYRAAERTEALSYRLVVPKANSCLFDTELEALRYIRALRLLSSSKLRAEAKDESLIVDKIDGLIRLLGEVP